MQPDDDFELIRYLTSLELVVLYTVVGSEFLLLIQKLSNRTFLGLLLVHLRPFWGG